MSCTCTHIDDCNPCCCQPLKTTSTTTTTTLCIGQPCEEIFDPNCIFYNGPNIPCYNLKTGDSAASIINTILNYFKNQCTPTTTTTTTTPISCNFNGGTAIGIPPTTTSTSSTTSTSTTSTSTSSTSTTSTSTSTSSTTSTTTQAPTTTTSSTSTSTSTSSTSTTSTSTSTSTSTTSSTSTSTSTTTTTTISCDQAICGRTYEGYGYLYNWFAIFGAGAQTNGGRNDGGIVNKLQPYADERNQWVVPSQTDFNTLITYLGGPSVAGGKLKTICTNPFTTNNGLWSSPNTGATNEVNWAGVPGGGRFYPQNNPTFSNFANLTYNGYWWTSTSLDSSSASYFILAFDNNVASISVTDRNNGNSLRLVRPATSAEQSLADGTRSDQNALLPHYVGNSSTYITVKIGNQIWTAQNLIDDKYNDGSTIPEEVDGTTWTSLTIGARCSYTPITAAEGQIELCNLVLPPRPTTTTTSSLTTTTTSVCPCLSYINVDDSPATGISYTDCVFGPQSNITVEPGTSICSSTEPTGPPFQVGKLVAIGTTCCI